ncbi:hypothetical protein A5418_03610 [Geobacillus subterraneus]|nr:hypothetical protein A5418_03610 [Geobacillus subterraneus]
MGILLSNGRSHFHSTGDPPARAIFMLAQVYLAPRVAYNVFLFVYTPCVFWMITYLIKKQY